MIRKLTILGLTLISLNTTAQTIKDGFYRVQNYGSQRYAYVYDCTGSIDYANTSADMGAIVLYRTPDKRLSDPASVIYVSGKGTSGGYELYDLESQNTGVYKLIKYYVTVKPSGVAGTYDVYEPKYNIHLYDASTSATVDKSRMDTKASKNVNNGYWKVIPVNSATDEYLGITPNTSLQLDGKYYKPYTIGFAFDFASAGMKAYYISDIKPDAAIITECVGTVPANTPVIIECSTAAAATNRINLYKSTPAAITGNKLAGNYFCYGQHADTDRREYNPATMRVLAVKDGKLQYITDTNNQYVTNITRKDVTQYCINANESYLPVPAGTAADLPVMTQEEYNNIHGTVGIETATTDNTSAAAYDLQGRRVDSRTSGLHIQAGRKTIR